jgi:translation initiation factor IF-3
MVGVVATRDAMRLAQQQGLDLVEVAPTAVPPVCRIMDFGKYRYEENMKRKRARKHQHSRSVKEIKFHANVGEHDYRTKVEHARGFLERGHKVKLSLTFRGRENVHRELGFEVIQRAVRDCEELAVVDMAPRLIGRSIVCMLGARPAKT